MYLYLFESSLFLALTVVKSFYSWRLSSDIWPPKNHPKITPSTTKSIFKKMCCSNLHLIKNTKNSRHGVMCFFVSLQFCRKKTLKKFRWQPGFSFGRGGLRVFCLTFSPATFQRWYPSAKICGSQAWVNIFPGLNYRGKTKNPTNNSRKNHHPTPNHGFSLCSFCLFFLP